MLLLPAGCLIVRLIIALNSTTLFAGAVCQCSLASWSYTITATFTLNRTRGKSRRRVGVGELRAGISCEPNSWKRKQIANAMVLPKVARACRSHGFEPPVIWTPEELMGDRNVR